MSYIFIITSTSQSFISKQEMPQKNHTFDELTLTCFTRKWTTTKDLLWKKELHPDTILCFLSQIIQKTTYRSKGRVSLEYQMAEVFRATGRSDWPRKLGEKLK